MLRDNAFRDVQMAKLISISVIIIIFIILGIAMLPPAPKPFENGELETRKDNLYGVENIIPHDTIASLLLGKANYDPKQLDDKGYADYVWFKDDLKPALNALGTPSDVITALEDLINDEDPILRQAAVAALKDAELSEDLIDILVEALGHEDRQVCEAAVYIFIRLGWDYIQGASPGGHFENHPEFHEILSNKLIVAAESDNQRLSAASVFALVLIQGDCINFLSGTFDNLESQDPDVRYFAAKAISNAWHVDYDNYNPELLSAAVPGLIEMLDDEDKGCRLAAIEALRPLGQVAGESIPGILAILSDADPEIRSAAAGALGVITSENSQVNTALLSLLEDEDAMVKIEAAGALGRLGIGAVDAVPVLISSLGLTEDDAEFYAIHYLQYFGPDAVEAVPSLVNLMQTCDSQTKSSILGTLGRIGPPAHEAVPALLSLMETADEYEMINIMTALIGIEEETELVYETLIGIIEDNSSANGYYAYRLIGDLAIKNPEYIPTIFKLLIEPVSYVIYRPENTIVDVLTVHYMPVDTILTYIDPSLYDNEYPSLSYILGHLGQRNSVYIPEIIDLLESDDPVIFIAACDALAEVGKPASDAIPILREHYFDADQEIAEKARSTSEQIIQSNVKSRGSVLN